MGDRVRPYLFYDVAVSICSTCYRKVEGKIVFQDGAVYMLKRCPMHGDERVLIADDVELLPQVPRGVHQAAGDAARVQHAGALGLPLRLRPLRRPPAALLPVAHRGHRPLQPSVPDLLRGQRAVAAAVPQPGSHRAADRRGRAERGRARRGADLRRRAHDPSGVLRHPRSGQGGAHPAPDGEHQRHPHRRRRGVREAARRVHARLRGLSAVRLVRTAAAHGAARRRPARRAPARARSAQRARRVDDAGRHAEEGPQRRRDRPDHRLRAGAAVRARRHVSADPGCRPPRSSSTRRPIG